jgi:hypothetical protein
VLLLRSEALTDMTSQSPLRKNIARRMHHAPRTTLCAVITLFAILPGCGGGSEYEGPPRYALSGKVTLGGEPVDGGVIAFIPPTEDGYTASGVITGGQYSIREGQGANEGSHRVEIRWSKPTGKKRLDIEDTGQEIEVVAEAIPLKYNEQSELTAEVSESQTSFDFPLTTE